ncbi:MAG: NADH-quinone oxidoreductase subunit J [Actinomycetota bacterium]|jgi:NADH-quinone oxidoreductase subunit J|nr:NADH-quinone oxidoreductase subunit J [Actinomycetota bacterium]
MKMLFAATVPDMITFIVCAVIVLSGAIGVITSRNAVHAALSLVMTLFGVAVLFIEQHAYFLAAVQVIVYAGAIVVLFLFVIMFLGVDRQEDVRFEPLKGQRPLALVLMAISLSGVLALAATANWVTGAHRVTGGLTAGHHTDTFLLGRSIFTTYLWAFEITAGLLVIAVVGAVVLARRPSDVHDQDAGALEPSAGAPEPSDSALEPSAGAPERSASVPEPSMGAPEPSADALGRAEVKR